ncbi:hypothetical protein RB195_002117 [Necator americanus]|uniref:Uncharacterized protein n=1 Tax=Necator americanus TaxID=51031 RepID=A0ABR1DHP9_NECAM
MLANRDSIQSEGVLKLMSSCNLPKGNMLAYAVTKVKMEKYDIGRYQLDLLMHSYSMRLNGKKLAIQIQTEDPLNSSRVEYEREQEAKETDTVKNVPGSDKVESMDDAAPQTVKTATINVKTMKRADGTYPPWMTGNHKNKLSKQNKAAKKKRLLKTKSRR